MDQIVVVDDHSEDGTWQVLQAMRDDRLHLTRSDHRGAGPARNVGIREADAEVVAFLDADDVWYSDKLESQLPLLQNDVAIVGGSVHYVGLDGRMLGSYIPHSDWAEASNALRRGEALPVPLTSWVVARSRLMAHGGFDESFVRAQDFELAVRMVQDGSRLVWPPNRAVAAYMIHDSGVTAQHYREQFLAAELVRARLDGRTTKSYSDWLLHPDVSARVRRRMISGEHYRRAAVAHGEGDRVGVLAHALWATGMSPLSVSKKLRARRRVMGRLIPEDVPSVVLAEFSRSRVS